MIDSNLLKLDGMKAMLIVLFLLGLLQAAAIAFQAFFLSTVITELWQGGVIESQIINLIAFFSCFALNHLLVFAQDTMLDRYSIRESANLRSRLLALAFDRDVVLASKMGTASVAVSATEGIDDIREFIRIIPPKTIGIVAISVPLLAYVFSLDALSGTILLVMLPALVMFMVLLGKQARSRAERRYESYRRLSNRFIDTLRGIREIESFGAGDVEGTSVFAFSERLRKATVSTLSTATLSSAVLDLCATFGVAAVAIMLAFRLMDGSLPLATGLCVLILSPEYFSPIRSFATDFHASLNGKNALSAFFDILDKFENSQSAAQVNAPDVIVDLAGNADEFALFFNDVSFTYEGSSETSLEIGELQIRPGEHVAIIGPSGAGKSTLAALCAGLESPNSGRITCFGEDVTSCAQNLVRFVPQNPHIFRKSLLDNVIFYEPSASREDAERACSAVGLDKLISELPDGIDTIVGEGARGLSGGQAHRIALARILLDENARVLVFDEPTAHLDIETELELKTRLIQIFDGRTVLFATHRKHWIRDMDRVIYLENGRVESDCQVELQARESSNLPSTSTCFANKASDGITYEMRAETIDHDVLQKPSDIETDTKANRLSWLRDLVTKYKRSVVVAILLGLVSCGFAALLMFASGYLICATATPSITLFSIMLPIAFVQLFGIGKPIAHYLERLVSHDWVLRVASDLRLSLYRAVRFLSGDPSRQRSTGEYLSILDDDIAHYQNLYLRVAFPIAIAYLLALAATAFFAVFSVPFALMLLFPLLLVIAVIPLITLRATEAVSLRSKQLRTKEYAVLSDDILGACDWILSRRGNYVLETHKHTCSEEAAGGFRVRLVNRSSTFCATLLLGFCACATTIWAGWYFAGPEGAANYIAAFALGFFPLIEPFTSLPESFSRAVEHAQASRRLKSFVSFGNTSTKKQANSSSHKDVVTSVSNSAITFVNASYRYPGIARTCIDAIDLTITPGQHVALLGQSGSGKTTLALMALGALDPRTGYVGVFNVRASELRGRLPITIGYLPQKPYLFDRTIRENLLMGVLSADDEQLYNVLGKVGLQEKVSSLPQGLDTPIGETGIGFSGGESHRIALARLLAADAPVIIVDEPFSALDEETEQSLLETLLETCEHRTLLLITHHLKGIERFDRVLFLEDGKISMDGSPKELLANNDRFQMLIEFDSVSVHAGL